MSLECSWMGLNLKNPCVMASLTLMSNVELDKHIEYYMKAISLGASAIVLPSVNPSLKKKSESVEASCLPIKSGISKNDNMAFAVLGPTKNLLSVEYGVALAEKLCKKCPEVPIIASIANVGTEQEILCTIQNMNTTGVSGIELNFSCPNVVTKDTESKNKLTISLLKRIREMTRLPLSLKLTPYDNYQDILLNLNDEVNGLTISNAYIGLIPPNIEPSFSPFSHSEQWSPCGVYGPYEKLLTFYHLYSIGKIAKSKNIDIACVGGLINFQDVIQAILLGADVVELSSAIAWNGINSFKKINAEIEKYLYDKKINSLNELKGVALPFIQDSADIVLYGTNNTKMYVDENKCKKCSTCLCCNKMCIAISQGEDGVVHINQDLCSGCGWCSHSCINNAIVKLNN